MKPRLLGPLTMTPQNFNNYGLESCSIMVVASDPPAIVVAETSGKLHHMLLLESDTVDESYGELDSSFVVFPTSWKLKVLETVELELGISDSKDALSCPIHLRADYINGHRYYVYHNTGLHAITMNFIGELQGYVEGKSSEVSFSKPSQVEYLVCTKLDNSKNINPIIGLGLHQHPPGLISCLSSGQVISLKIIVDPNLLTILEKPSEDSFVTPNMQSMMKEQFTNHIQNILQRKVSQPILSSDSTIRPQKSYEILTQSINVLNEHYIQKQSQVVREILKRIDLQNKVKEQQLSEIRNLENEREIISQKAHLLAEKFDECSEKQTLLTKKCQDLLGLGNVSLPNNIIAEKEFTNNVNNIQNTTKEFLKAIERLKENMNKQNYHISKYTNTNSSKKVELPEKQQKALQEILMSITSEIDSQIQVLKKIKKVVQ
ncbi:NUP88 family protein [Megaselia abdita]